MEDWTGFIFWRVIWRRFRCRGRCKSRCSCWRFAAGGGRSLMMMPDRWRRGRLLAMFHSSGLFACDLCCSIHARPFSLACGKSKKTRNSFRKLHIHYYVSCKFKTDWKWKKKTIFADEKEIWAHTILKATGCCTDLLTDSPCTVPDDISTVERVDWYIVQHFARVVSKHRLPTAEQHLVLKGGEDKVKNDISSL